MTSTIVKTEPTANVIDVTEWMREAAKAQLAERRSVPDTKKARTVGWASKLTAEQRDQAIELFEDLPSVFGVFDPDVVNGPLNTASSNVLVEEYLSIQAAQEALNGRLERLKLFAGQSITAANREKGLDDPDLTTGSVQAPQFASALVREGGGRNDPTWNLESLRDALGADYGQVVDVFTVPEVVIPAYVDQTVNEQALAAYLVNHPEAGEKIAEAVSPGAPKPVRFTIRKTDGR